MSVLTATTHWICPLQCWDLSIIVNLEVWAYTTLPAKQKCILLLNTPNFIGHYSYQGLECSPIWMFDNLTSL